MRLWSLHPRYLDSPGLVACWRESLLAQKVLAGETKGYRSHPQLARFRAGQPAAIGTYLHGLADEADRRGYRFQRTLIRADRDDALSLPVTDGQLRLEWRHLQAKLSERSAGYLVRLEPVDLPEPHPLFHVVAGLVEPWERLAE